MKSGKRSAFCVILASTIHRLLKSFARTAFLGNLAAQQVCKPTAPSVPSVTYSHRAARQRALNVCSVNIKIRKRQLYAMTVKRDNSVMSLDQNVARTATQANTLIKFSVLKVMIA